VPSTALFRIASLHPFSDELTTTENGTGKALRFPD
jgi:hypothetical protein